MEYTICDKKLIVCAGITEICYTDFFDVFNSNNLDEVQLPTTVRIIHDNTFFDFPNIKRIRIPKSVQYIGSQAFWGLDDLEELTIPIAVPLIGKHAFCNCTKLTLTILGNPADIPSGWDTEFAINIKDVRFQNDQPGIE